MRVGAARLSYRLSYSRGEEHSPLLARGAGALFSSLLLFAALLLSSCSGEAPTIDRLFWQLDLYMDANGGTPEERLSVFALSMDRDGFEDIAEWELSHPVEELRWSRSPDELRRVSSGEGFWLGWNGVGMPFGETLPRGEYHLRIIDRAGEAADTRFTIPSDLRGAADERVEKKLFPALRFEEKGIRIISSFDRHSISLQNGEGSIIEVVEVDTKRLPEDRVEAWVSQAAASIVLGSFDRKLGVGLKRGPYIIPERYASN